MAMFLKRRLLVPAVVLALANSAVAEEDGTVTVTEGEETGETEEATQEQREEIERLQAKLDALRKQKAEMEMKKKSQELGMLQDLLAQMQDLQGEEDSGAATPKKNDKADKTVDMVEKMVGEMMASRKEPEVSLEDNEIHACMLMAGRRYGKAEAWSRTHSNEDAAKAAEETRALLTAFATEDKENFDMGDAAKHTAFKSIVSCLKGIGKEGLSAFDTAGGFALDSSEALPDSFAEEAEARNSALLTGDVFALSFEKSRWKQLRMAAQRLPWMNDESSKKSSGKDEL